jgi:hypothetical protein
MGQKTKLTVVYGHIHEVLVVEVIRVVGVSWLRPCAAREAAIIIHFKAMMAVVHAAMTAKSRLYCSPKQRARCAHIYTTSFSG